MSIIHIIYSSREGQTRKIAGRIHRVVEDAGCLAEVCDVARIPLGRSWGDVDGLIVGGSIHVGRHARELIRFIKSNVHAIEQTPTAFFSVSLSAAGDAAQRIDAERCLEDFLTETAWHPAMTAVFPGALLYRDYGLLKRMLMRWIARRSGGPTDTSRNHEFTDWNQVNDFARQFVRLVEPVHSST